MKRGVFIIVGTWLTFSALGICGSMALKTAQAAALVNTEAVAGNVPSGGMLSGGQWTVGALALGVPVNGGNTRSGLLPGQVAPVRLGDGLSFSSVGDGAMLRPWAAQVMDGDRSQQRFSGVLLDIPYGSFTFTPSFGAGYSLPQIPSGHSSMAMRSQLEVNYRFENSANLSVGYSRLSVMNGNGPQRDDNDMVSLTYRLPFTSLWPW